MYQAHYLTDKGIKAYLTNVFKPRETHRQYMQDNICLF
jgi:hypothetical protein